MLMREIVTGDISSTPTGVTYPHHSGFLPCGVLPHFGTD